MAEVVLMSITAWPPTPSFPLYLPHVVLLFVVSTCLSCAIVRATEPKWRHYLLTPLALLLYNASAPSHKYYRLQLPPLPVLS